ncbi:MAG: flagellar hook protein FlgE [Bacillota bacterium]
MMRSLFSGVSGLRNHQVRMDVIGNNIANVNTIGFKSGRVNFQEIFSQTLRGASSPRTDLGGTNPQQVGLGMTIASIDTMFSQGNLQTTGKNTDLAIQGNGFFILDNGGSQVYTRAGMFDVDADGNLINPEGMRLMGWQADPLTGVIDPTKAVQTLKIPIGQAKMAQATTRVTYTSNLAADAPVGTRVTTSVKVFDSLGTAHDIRVDFVKTGNNQWDWEAVGYGSVVANLTGGAPDPNLTTPAAPTPAVPQGSTLPSATGYQIIVDATGSTASLRDSAGNVLGTINNLSPTGGNQTFLDASGRPLLTLTFPNPPVSGTATLDIQNPTNSGTINYNTQGIPITGTTDTLSFNPGNGANPLSITMDFVSTTQMAAPASSIAATGRDGYAMGALNTFTIDSAGVITGSFNNGLTQKIGQIALANFSNIGGLMKSGNNNYVETNNSGLPQIGLANNGGRGSIAPANLEQSNVDLSQEFANMIITQRGFQSNSRVITTSDEMLQELVNLKR